MLSKRKRVDKKLFMEVFKEGRVINNPFFTFRYIKQNKPQYAFVVSKTIYKKAIDRNKLRRIGYNTLKNMIIPNYAGIFFFKKDVKGLKKADIEKSILDFSLFKIQ